MPTLFCRDCKWSRPKPGPFGFGRAYKFARCASPSAMGAEYLVHPGNSSEKYCSVERYDYGEHTKNCGPGGKNWEPKP